MLSPSSLQIEYLQKLAQQQAGQQDMSELLKTLSTTPDYASSRTISADQSTLASGLPTMPSNSEVTVTSSLGRLPNTFEELDELYKQGKVSRDDAARLEVMISNGEIPLTQKPPETDNEGKAWWERMPPINFSGSDLSTELYSLGMNLAAPSGTKGKGLGIASSAGSALLGASRDFLSGFAMQKQSNRFQDYYDQQRQKVYYTPDDQFRDDSYLNANNFKADGGTIDDPYKSQVDEYNFFKAQLNSPKNTKQLVDRNSFPDLYANSPTGLTVKNVYKSSAGDNAYFFEYNEPTQQTFTNQSTPAVTPTLPPAYLNPYTGDRLDPSVYGTPTSQTDVQLAQGIDMIALRQKADQMVKTNNIDYNKQLLSTLTPQQQEEMRAKRMTPSQYVNTMTQAKFEFGGDMNILDGYEEPVIEGDPETPPVKKVPNPKYQEQLKLKKSQEAGYRNPDQYSVKLEGKQLDEFFKQNKATFPDYGKPNAFLPSVVYKTKNNDAFYVYYPEPLKELEVVPEPAAPQKPQQVEGPPTWNLATVIELKKADGSTQQVYVPKGAKYPTKGYSYDKFVEEMGPIQDFNVVPSGKNYNTSTINTISGIKFPNDYGKDSQFLKVAYEERIKELEKLNTQKKDVKFEYGGYKQGDKIKFKHNGQMVEGVFDRIENGKLILQ